MGYSEYNIQNSDLKREFANILDMALQLRDNGHLVEIDKGETELPEMPFVIDIEDQSYFYQNKVERDLDFRLIKSIFTARRINFKRNN